MDKKAIYLLYGESGQWSDYNSWNVDAFTCEKDAKEICTHLNALAKLYDDVLKYEGKGFNHPLRRELKEAMEKVDPTYYRDYDGASYDVEEVLLLDGCDPEWMKKKQEVRRFFEHSRRKLQEKKENERSN